MKSTVAEMIRLTRTCSLGLNETERRFLDLQLQWLVRHFNFAQLGSLPVYILSPITNGGLDITDAGESPVCAGCTGSLPKKSN
jgi:hypothetical protein